jgi:folate-binding protein YgfZ
MSTPCFFQLNRISVIDVRGDDAAAMVQNLTTNEVASLQAGKGCESFVTDVRGKTLAHVHVYCEHGFLRLIGPKGQSDRIAAHVERYTIREDAKPVILDDDFEAIVLPPAVAAVVCGELNQAADLNEATKLRKTQGKLGDVELDLYQSRWIGEKTAVVLVPRQEANRVCESLAAGSIPTPAERSGMGDESTFHHARTMAGFPWFGIDLDEANLPQEANRDSLAISFTKGCYLGQETVARLDALGQVQKKLVRWAIAGAVPEAGSKLVSGEKTVGRLTSVAADAAGGAIAIGMARRSHFDAGATATGVIESTGAEFTGTVL